MNLKFFGTGLAALAFLASSLSAQAADIPRPVYKGIRPVVAYYNWTGFYVGLNAGYGFGTSKWSLSPHRQQQAQAACWAAARSVTTTRSARSSGASRATSTGRTSRTLSPALPLVTCSTSNRWLATFRGRLGYAFDRWLPYITGGGAYGNVKATASLPIAGLAASTSNNQFGWTVGAGLEYAFLGNWTAKLEYLYVDLGSFNAGDRAGREQCHASRKTSFAPA